MRKMSHMHALPLAQQIMLFSEIINNNALDVERQPT
jgi:hypothetical protein